MVSKVEIGRCEDEEETVTKTRREEKTRGRRRRVDMNDLVLEAAPEQAADPPRADAPFSALMLVVLFSHFVDLGSSSASNFHPFTIILASVFRA